MSDALTIALANPKGGVGKTTAAVHLAVAAHRAGHEVQLVDADPQGSVLDWSRRTPDAYDGPAVHHVPKGEPLSAVLSGLTADVVVLDSPARLGERTGSVLSVADCALVPVRPSGLDLWGTAEFVGLLEGRIEEEGLRAAFVRSQADVRTSLADELEAALDRLGLPLLDGLTHRVAYARSMSEGQTVLDGYDVTAEEEVEQLLEDTGRLLS